MNQTILLVEDHISDVRLMEMALKQTSFDLNMQTVSTGEKALKFLSKAEPYDDAKTPALILLDLNIPGISGKEVLARVKSNPKLKSIPVIILSSSDYRKDVQECYDLHANCYLRKPSSLEALYQLVEMVIRFWLKDVQLA